MFSVVKRFFLLMIDLRCLAPLSTIFQLYFYLLLLLLFRRWLTNLCETANVIMLNRRKWCKTADTLQEIKHKATIDVQFLKDAKTELIRNGGDILETKVARYKQMYEDFLKANFDKN